MTEEARKQARQAIKRQLGRYQAIKQEAAHIEALLKDLDGAPSGVQMDGMPRGSGTGDPVASIVDQRLALRDMYITKLGKLWAAQEHIEALIDCLEPTERTLMRHRYIEGMEWEPVCVAIGYSWRQTHNIHARALDKLVDIENMKGLTCICD